MFLSTIFVMFFALSFMPQPEMNVAPLPQRIAEQRAEVAEAEKAVEQARADLAQAEAGGREAVTLGRGQGIASGALARPRVW